MKNNLYQYGLIGLGLLLAVFLFIRSRKKGGDNTDEANELEKAKPDIKLTGKTCAGRTPRGVRNNNPGNLRLTAEAWKGKVPNAINTDGDFEQFEEWVYGVRAMLKLLRNYIGSGHNTIAKIIRRYAPTTENSTNQYINTVVQRTRMGANQLLDRDDKTVMRKLVQEMAAVELGCHLVNDSEFNQAWNLL
ncbi:hypothetical protein [Haliscomenobacter hydrossis]|uniref:Uncharacterized protein n=1 Tax=Haliscomenobacter hydrossis (strain ATCC 27775 / DSM 1100 / LMG 10767 / O) TaxID=760192 RepID=F4KZ76_HALH1|nr:hypothetical protein [Haliscomenobacter hydrossis]AEE53730.1 hypothetical protein Halhy_5907 [Haliscomenobacter hydrossis DSM 1100]